MATDSLVFDKGLPASLQTENLLLGLVLINHKVYWEHVEGLEPAVFSTESNRRIFARMQDLAAHGEAIDHVTITNELIKWGQLDQIGGMSAIMDLTDHVPEIANPEAYVAILKEKHALRQLIFASQRTIDQALIGERSPEQILESLETATRDIGEREKAESGRSPVEIIREHTGGYSGFMDPSSVHRGILTGFFAVDENCGGFRGDQLIIVGARPSQGKTSYAVTLIEHLCPEYPIEMFSLEMSAASILRRLMCMRAKVSLTRVNTGRVTEDGGERKRMQDAIAEIAEYPLKIHDGANLTMKQIAREAAKAVEKRGARLIIVDHMGLISPGNLRFDRKDLEVGHNSRSLKMLAKSLDVPVLALSQLSRASAKAKVRPELTDLRNSGDIEQDADIVDFLHRPEYYERENESLKGQAELLRLKHRDGACATFNLRFTHEWAMFRNPDQGEKAVTFF